MKPTIGIIGVGELGSALVEGLSSDDRAEAPSILLSPRGTTISAELGERFANVATGPDNQAVVDGADLLVLALRPQDWQKAVRELDLTSITLVISVMAGVRLDTLRDALPPGVAVVRALPMPSVRDRSCLTIVLPSHPVSDAIFTDLGGILPVQDEDAFNVLTAVTASVSSHVAYLATLTSWAARRGIAPEQADAYVRSLFGGAAQAVTSATTPLSGLVEVFETPGGLNHRVRTSWFVGRSEKELASTLDDLLADLP